MSATRAPPLPQAFFCQRHRPALCLYHPPPRQPARGACSTIPICRRAQQHPPRRVAAAEHAPGQAGYGGAADRPAGLAATARAGLPMPPGPRGCKTHAGAPLAAGAGAAGVANGNARRRRCWPHATGQQPQEGDDPTHLLLWQPVASSQQQLQQIPAPARPPASGWAMRRRPRHRPQALALGESCIASYT